MQCEAVYNAFQAVPPNEKHKIERKDCAKIAILSHALYTSCTWKHAKMARRAREDRTQSYNQKSKIVQIAMYHG